MSTEVFIERKNLNLLLEEALRRPVITVVAGAGYGKTRAVYSFLQKAGISPAWVQLSGRDNIPERFWENFSAAVATVTPDIAALFKGAGFPETERQFSRYVEVPRGRVDPLGNYVFVFDDFHLVSDPRVLTFIERSLRSGFPSVKTILISRRDIPINLMSLKSRGRLAEITQEDLRFSGEEIAEYLALLGGSLPAGSAAGTATGNAAGTADAILADTEGWAFAVNLAALQATRGSVYAPGALKSNIFKLIESEVVQPLPAEVRRFLIKLSLI